MLHSAQVSIQNVIYFCKDDKYITYETISRQVIKRNFYLIYFVQMQANVPKKENGKELLFK